MITAGLGKNANFYLLYNWQSSQGGNRKTETK